MHEGERRFRRFVTEALEELPEFLRRALPHVSVVVADRCEREDLLGLYEGVPKTERTGSEVGLLPDKVTLFREALEEEAEGDDELLYDLIYDTLWHEMGHALGYDEEELEGMEGKIKD